ENNCGSDPCVKRLLSLQNAGSCFSGGTSPAPGSKTNATIDGINVRFDQRPNGTSTGMDLTPAPIVIDGLKPHTTGGGALQCNRAFDSATPSGFTQNDTNSTNYDSTCGAATPTGSCPMPRDRSYNSVGGSGGTQIGTNPLTSIVSDLNAYWQNH